MACTHAIQCKNFVNCTAISPDGQLLAVGLAGGGPLLLDARTGERRATRSEGYTSTFSVAFSPASSSQPLLLATSFLDNVLRVWDCSSGACVAELVGHSIVVQCVAFSPDGRLLASAFIDNSVRMWRTDDWHAPPAVLSGHTHWVTGVSFSCDGRLLVSCSEDGMVWHILDSGAAATTAPAAVAVATSALEANQSVRCVAFSPVDSRLLAYCGWADFLVLARVSAGEGAIAVERKLQGHTDNVLCFAFSLCGRRLASASDDRTVRLWSVASGACLHVLRGHEGDLNAVAFFPDGKQLASSALDKTVRIWTLCAWSDQTHHLFGAPFKAAVFSLMCVHARLEQHAQLLPRLPMEVWLLIFGQLQLALGEDGISKIRPFPSNP